ncbi:MAG: hypothetical protein JO107_16115 [Hyphomicrobiales bacterium]|nr:hypothetical protein [Hyphomicrobiales bacterium]
MQGLWSKVIRRASLVASAVMAAMVMSYVAHHPQRGIWTDGYGVCPPPAAGYPCIPPIKQTP